MKKAQVTKTQARGSAGNAEASIANTVHLAERINSHHAAATHHAEQVIVNARAAGELLLEAKDTVLHGEWQDWLEANFEGSGRTARAYMRIARRWDLIRAKRQSTATLSISEALKLIRYGRGRV